MVVWALTLAGYSFVAAADLPADIQRGIDKGRSGYEEACKSADKKLLAAFDAEIDAIRKQPGLKGEAKQAAIQGIEKEKETYEKNATIPFSPRMRAAAIAYLKVIRQATRPAELAYDRAIDHLTKAKDDAAAAALVAQKQKLLKSPLVARLSFTNANKTNSFTSSLFANGMGGSSLVTWVLETDKLIITNRQPGSPPGGWVDALTFDNNGQTFVAKNQIGVIHTGNVIEPTDR
jgi:hypothetical protein